MPLGSDLLQGRPPLSNLAQGHAFDCVADILGQDEIGALAGRQDVLVQS